MVHQRRGTSRSVRKKGSKIWTSVIAVELDPLATFLDLTLVAGADFAPFETVTLMGIYGWLDIRPASVAVQDDSVFWYIAKFDSDIGTTSAANDPFAAATYVDEDIMWTGGATCTNGTTANLVGGAGVHQEIKITGSKRKIREGENIRLIFANLGGTGEQLFSGVLRTILTAG